MSLKIIFAGTPAFAVPSLQALINSCYEIVAVYTQPDRAAGRGRKVQMSPIKQLALLHHLPVFQPDSLRGKDAIAHISNCEADVMVVVAYGLLLPQAILDAPKYGSINVHASLLPRWRGAAPIQSAILHGDHETGVTIMKMVSALDAGDILLNSTTKITPQDNSQTLHDRLANMGADLLLDTLKLIAVQGVHRQSQDKDLVTYAYKIKKEDAVIDWQMSALEIDRKVRAFYNWPVAYTHLGEQKLRIWEVALSQQKINLAPGEIKIDKEITVGCRQGAIKLVKVQLPGGKIISATDFINAFESKIIRNQARFT